MKVSPIEVFRIRRAVWLHFNTPSYDAFKYRFQIKVDETKFRNSRGAFWYDRMSKEYDMQDIKEMFAANYSGWNGETKGCWINVPDASYIEIWKQWKVHLSKVNPRFIADLETLHTQLGYTALKELFVLSPSGLPNVIMAWKHRQIHLESLVILDKITHFVVQCPVINTIMWPSISRQISRYEPWVDSYIDEVVCKKSLLTALA